MSYILDALKKSDRERKRGGVPDLQTVHIPISTESQTPRILYGFISVLLLVLAFVIGMVISGHESQEKQIDSVVERDEKNSSEKALVQEKLTETKSTQATETVKTVVNKTVVSESKKTAVSPLKEKNILINESQAEPKKPMVQAASVTSLMRNRNINEIPYLNELPDYQQSSVPDMIFAGHVYSTTPSNRSVIINNYAMSEGDTVVQGIKVVQITSSGVVFSLHDQLFRIDILQDWSFE